MLPSPELRIIIPACNEIDRLAPTIRDYCSVFASTGTVLVVANGCVDGTPDLVRSLQSEYTNLEMLEIGGRIGKGGAVRAGLWTGAEAYLGFVDADGSTSAHEFLNLFQQLQTQSVDGVIGSRWLAGACVEPRQPALRRLASRAFNSVVRLLFRLPYSDTQCGAKIFTRRAIAEILHSLEVANFAFDIEVLWRLCHAKFRIIEVPTVWSDRQHGTKIRLAASSWSMLKSVLRLRMRNSWLWLLPFVDRFAHGAVIPVVNRHRMLVVGGSLSALRATPQMSEFFDALDVAGVSLSDLPGETYAPSSWLSSLLLTLKRIVRYALSSHREYDAVIEVAGGSLTWIPYFSMKPSFVVSAPGHELTSRLRNTYLRASFIDLCVVSPLDAAATVLLVQSGAAIYDAVFYDNKDAIALHCASGAGARERHVLSR